MKLRTKRPEWKSLMPLQLSRKSAMRFFLFPKVQSAVQSPDDTPVYLNVYDLTPMNGYIYWAGLGIFYSGIEVMNIGETFCKVHAVEYAFGAHDYPTSGVFEVEPRQCPGFRFRKSICLGTTCLDPIQVRQFMELQSVNYNGDTYHLITKNCNHFCKGYVLQIDWKQNTQVGKSARQNSSAICNCLLPESLKIPPVGHDPNSQSEDYEKKRLRNPFSCFSSISSQKQLTSSTAFPPSPVKERLPHCSSRKSSTSNIDVFHSNMQVMSSLISENYRKGRASDAAKASWPQNGSCCRRYLR
ncbi:hypothetical protein ACP4OV_015695 [Aristida adscensionis]